MVLIDERGHVLEANRAALSALDVAPEDLVGRPLDQALQAPPRRARVDTAETLGRGDHAPVPLEAVAIESLGPGARLVCLGRPEGERGGHRRDREEILDELARRGDRLAMLLSQMPTILWSADTDLCLTFVAGSGLARLGLEPEQLDGVDLRDFYMEEPSGRLWLDAHETVLRSGEQLAFEIPFRGYTWNARIKPLHGPDGEVNGVLSVAEDVSDLVAARIEAQERLAALERIDEERRRLLEQMTRVRREERHRLARDIHDDLGQLLTSASLYSATLAAQAPQVDDASLTSLRSVINDAMRSARRTVASLRETGVGGDLAVAIERLVQDAGATDVRIDLQDAGSDRPLPGDVAAAAYRIVQEALTNAVKHAKANTISIVIDQRADCLTVVIEDDGVGFDDSPGRLAGRGGYGLVGMGERAQGVRGTLAIASAVGRGTAVRLEVPLEGGDDR
ncbi:MAG: hypothetical protein JWN67_829 [Actinomycetia bacterium]|nr:hypothetical protein [Actinomycetes bacterium]